MPGRGWLTRSPPEAEPAVAGDAPTHTASPAPPFFSVIIPVYNRADSISAAIDSVLTQTCSDLEIIVIDDGSTDATPLRLAAYGDRITVLRQNNAGGGPARQAGISRARGEYVAFLDSDDFWPPWTLETYRRVASETGSPALLLGTALHTTVDPQGFAFKPAALAYTAHADFLAHADDYRWFGFSVIAARRSAIPISDALPAGRVVAQDLHLLLMMGTATGFAMIESPAAAVYRLHAGNISGNPAAIADAMRSLLTKESQGVFPGGTSRRNARRTLLYRSIRAASMTILRSGRLRDALALYRSAFWIHLATGRWRYLIGFPLACLGELLLGMRHGGNAHRTRA